MNNQVAKETERDLITTRVLVLRAEAILANTISKTNSKKIKSIYRSLTSLGSKISELNSDLS